MKSQTVNDIGNVNTETKNKPIKEKKTRKKEVSTDNFHEVNPVRTEEIETVAVIKDSDYTILDWVRILLILTLPIVNIIAIIIWIAKRSINKTAGNYALGLIIYLCIMAAIGAVYYFFIM